jgi:SpoIID/LytB domain protein
MGSLGLMRRLLLPVALFAALVFAASAPSATLFVIRGKGWGHGVGMSQWGAYGLARGYAVDHQYTWQQIIAHYFHHTTIGTRSKTVSVLLVGSKGSVSIGSEFRVKAGTRSVQHSGDSTVSKTSKGRIKVSGIEKTFASPATFSPTSGHLHLGARHYRGNLVVTAVGGGVRVVNRLPVDGYVRGVVTNESPSSWGAVGAQAALEAQAVAARSYALWTVAHGGGKCAGNLCPDTRDQVYSGFDSETANGRAAVSSTAGKVVLSGGSVAETFFSSSSGGRTAASVDTWGGNRNYLESTPDPADLNPSNPNRAWRLLLKPAGLGNRLGTRNPSDAVVSSRVSGRVNAISVGGKTWSKVVGGGPEHFRAVMRAKSSRFWIGVQSLNTDVHRSKCKRPVHLTVFAHGVGAITFEQRKVTSTTWTKAALNKVDAKHWKTTRVPCVSMDYRIRSRDAVGPRVHVDVSPNIAFNARQRAGSLAGKVNPLLPGQTVTIQRKTASGWKVAASTTIQGDGSFKAVFDVKEATYRAKVVPPAATGLVTGFSPPLRVQFG